MMRWITAAGAAALLSGCSFGHDMTATDAAVVAFHQRLDAGQYDAILRDADPELSGTSAEMTQLLAAVHDRLGPVGSFDRTNFNETLNGQGHLVGVDYHAMFRGGPADENFTFRIHDGRPVLAGYHISSNALITNAPAPPVVSLNSAAPTK